MNDGHGAFLVGVMATIDWLSGLGLEAAGDGWVGGRFAAGRP